MDGPYSIVRHLVVPCPPCRAFLFALTRRAAMSSRIAIQESARVAPVGAGWAAFVSADPGTQVGVIAGLLTCLYMLGQILWIWRRWRIESRKLAMAEREHQATLDRHQAEMAHLGGQESGDSKP